MNLLSQAERVKIVAALVEGNSLRSVSRMTGIARNTITKLLVDLGEACMAYHDEHVRNVRVHRLQCDEIWAYVGAKKARIGREKGNRVGRRLDLGWIGCRYQASCELPSRWTWSGMGTGFYERLRHLASYGTPQITTDAHKPYLKAVEEAFGGDAGLCDAAQRFSGHRTNREHRYSPATCIGCDMKTISGVPDRKTCQHKLCRAPEPHHAHVDASVYAADKWIQQET